MRSLQQARWNLEWHLKQLRAAMGTVGVLGVVRVHVGLWYLWEVVDRLPPGPRDRLRAGLRRLVVGPTGYARVRLPGERFPIYLRPHSSDVPTFSQVLVERSYEMPYLRAPDVILDAGANIGLASRYFASAYPTARIVCVEPDAQNFRLLQLNAGPLDRVTLVHGALWHAPAEVEIANPGDEPWAYHVRGARHGRVARVPGKTVPQLLALASDGSRPAERRLLKIDIEGAEQEVFGPGCEEWLPLVDAIAIELHERDRPGSSAPFEAAVARHDFRRFVNGENVILVRPRSLAG
jgi:FkbM family methyltransferase